MFRLAASRAAAATTDRVPPTPTCRWSWDGERLASVAVTATFTEITGQALDAYAPQLWAPRVHADDLELFRGFLGALARGESARVEHRLVHTDGRERWVVAVGWRGHDARGRIVCEGMFTDVTDLHSRAYVEEIEAVSARTSATLQHVLESIDDIIFSAERSCTSERHGGDLFVRIVGGRFERFTGTRGADITSLHSLLRLVEPSARRSLFRWLRDLSGERGEHRCLVRSPQGPRWVELRLTSERCAYGCVERAFLVARDVTARVESERAARKSREIVQALLEACPDAVSVVDSEDNILFCNPKMTAWLGKSEGRIDEAAVVTSELAARRREMRALAMTNASVVETFRYAREGQPSVWTKVTYAPFVDADEHVTGTICFAHDVTEEHQAAERLASALRAKEQLVREVHHRVKNNMQIISSLLNLQLASTQTPEIARALEESGRRIRAMALVQDLLHESIDSPTVNAASYFGALVDSVCASFGASDRVRRFVRVAPVELPVDLAMHLGLVASELVSNTHKHGLARGRSGTLEFVLSREGPRLNLAVSDDGAPLGDYRTGLGLELVSSLSEQLGGDFRAEAGPPKRFLVSVPLEGPR